MEKFIPFGKGKGIMIVGLNPSIKNQCKEFWLTLYGKFLNEVLIQADIVPSEVWITNLYKYPTPYNRALKNSEISIGFQELMSEISIMKPQVIVPLGRQANQAFEKLLGLYDSKFKVFYGVEHPSYVRRFKRKKVDEYINQFKEIKSWKKK